MQICVQLQAPVAGSHSQLSVAHVPQVGLVVGSHAVKQPSGTGASHPGALHTFALQPGSSGAQLGSANRAPG
jgi:hypothetical protein